MKRFYWGGGLVLPHMSLISNAYEQDNGLRYNCKGKKEKRKGNGSKFPASNFCSFVKNKKIKKIK
jgi:hypothetical protein